MVKTAPLKYYELFNHRMKAAVVLNYPTRETIPFIDKLYKSMRTEK
jgi:hypothetical protein